jgi:MFS family permease
MFRTQLYKKPFNTAAVFAALGAGLIMAGFALAASTGSMGYYAMVAFGIFALIIGIVTFVMYTRLEREFRRTISDKPLLRYTVEKSLLEENITRNIKEVKSQNKAILMTMLFFCALTAVVLPFLFEDGTLFIFIGIGMAVFLTLAAWAVTSYRIVKLKKGTNEIILSKDGAFVSGEFHSWRMPGTAVTEVRYKESDGKPQSCGILSITYTAASYPAPLSQTIHIPVPDDQAFRIPEVIKALEQ